MRIWAGVTEAMCAGLRVDGAGGGDGTSVSRDAVRRAAGVDGAVFSIYI
jgi:hypothetical protein